MTHRVKEKMETREVIVLTAPWCDSCDEFLEDIQRACDFSEMEFIQVDEGSSKYNSHANRFHDDARIEVYVWIKLALNKVRVF